jgi:integrase
MVFVEQKPLLNHELVRYAIVVLGKNVLFLPPLLAAIMRGPRYVATIARVHLAADLLNPCSSEAVRLGLKQMGRETSARQDQAHPLGWKDIKEFIESAGEGLRADRERAMLCVAYETLARRGELVALEIRDTDFHPDGTGHALIRCGKTDAEGQGRAAYLSRETVRWLKLWLEHAEIPEGQYFGD